MYNNIIWILFLIEIQEKRHQMKIFFLISLLNRNTIGQNNLNICKIAMAAKNGVSKNLKTMKSISILFNNELILNTFFWNNARI